MSDILRDHDLKWCARWLQQKAVRIVGPSDADDMVQATLEEWIRSRHALREHWAALAWLARTLRNNCLMLKREAAARTRARDDPAIVESIAIVGTAEALPRFRTVSDERIERALASLSLKHRLVLEMSMRGERYREISRKCRFSRARDPGGLKISRAFPPSG